MTVKKSKRERDKKGDQREKRANKKVTKEKNTKREKKRKEKTKTKKNSQPHHKRKSQKSLVLSFVTVVTVCQRRHKLMFVRICNC